MIRVLQIYSAREQKLMGRDWPRDMNVRDACQPLQAFPPPSTLKIRQLIYANRKPLHSERATWRRVVKGYYTKSYVQMVGFWRLLRACQVSAINVTRNHPGSSSGTETNVCGRSSMQLGVLLRVSGKASGTALGLGLSSTCWGLDLRIVDRPRL